MTTKTCGNCRFFRVIDAPYMKPYHGICEFVLPDMLKKYDDDISQRNMVETDYCSFHKKKKA